jgi:hypothetical protein
MVENIHTWVEQQRRLRGFLGSGMNSRNKNQPDVNLWISLRGIEWTIIVHGNGKTSTLVCCKAFVPF